MGVSYLNIHKNLDNNDMCFIVCLQKSELYILIYHKCGEIMFIQFLTHFYDWGNVKLNTKKKNHIFAKI